MQRFDVCLLRCKDYSEAELDRAIAGSAELGGFPDIRGKRILVKPNLLRGAAPEKAITTNPAFLAAVLRFLHQQGPSKIMVGDSPGWQKGSMAARTSGLLVVVQEAGAEWIEMDSGSLRAAPRGLLVKAFVLSTALDECDLIVNLPKLKTHRLMNYTGAIKNLFGLTPGLAKSAMHLRFPDRKDFGTMLVDLSSCLPPVFTFMDSIVAMEGEGPGNGLPRHTGFMFASADPAALDWVAAQCIGYSPERIPYLLDAFGRSWTTGQNPSVGPLGLEESRIRDFALIPYGTAGTQVSSLPERMPGFFKRLVRKALVSRPIFHAERCTGCSSCVKICPAKALVLGKDRQARSQVRIDDKACITCFCCHEVCPAGAISIGRVLSRRAREKKRP